MYRTYIRAPRLDRLIYAFLDSLVNAYSRFRGYTFPDNYIRRWKLDMLHGIYEKETAALFASVITPGMVIVDIGAHIGYFTRLFSALVGPRGAVYAFEADKENFQLLQRNIRRFKNVRAFEVAITDRRGAIDFFHYDEKAGLHSILPNVPLEYAKRKITVESADLDSALEHNNVRRVDLIKMDIEGGEWKALEGMKKTISSHGPLMLLVEFAPAWIRAAGTDPLTFLRTIETYGFTLHAVTSHGLVKIDTINDAQYQELLPKTPTHFNEFINMYCVKR